MRSFADAPESATRPETLAEATRSVAASDSLQIALAAGGGGFTAIIKPHRSLACCTLGPCGQPPEHAGHR